MVVLPMAPSKCLALYYGEKEWNRLTATPRDQVSFHIHTHYLKKFIRAGDKVLEAGAGAGRFTIELAKLGASITVGDVSKVQLELNKKYVKEAAMRARHRSGSWT